MYSTGGTWVKHSHTPAETWVCPETMLVTPSRGTPDSSLRQPWFLIVSFHTKHCNMCMEHPCTISRRVSVNKTTEASTWLMIMMSFIQWNACGETLKHINEILISIPLSFFFLPFFLSLFFPYFISFHLQLIWKLEIQHFYFCSSSQWVHLIWIYCRSIFHIKYLSKWNAGL